MNGTSQEYGKPVHRLKCRSTWLMNGNRTRRRGSAYAASTRMPARSAARARTRRHWTSIAVPFSWARASSVALRKGQELWISYRLDPEAQAWIAPATDPRSLVLPELICTPRHQILMMNHLSTAPMFTPTVPRDVAMVALVNLSRPAAGRTARAYPSSWATFIRAAARPRLCPSSGYSAGSGSSGGRSPLTSPAWSTAPSMQSSAGRGRVAAAMRTPDLLRTPDPLIRRRVAPDKGAWSSARSRGRIAGWGALESGPLGSSWGQRGGAVVCSASSLFAEDVRGCVHQRTA
jgi:hypothetical protein